MTPEPQIPKQPEQGRYVTKPEWWYRIIEDREIHERIRMIARKRERELSCFGGK